MPSVGKEERKWVRERRIGVWCVAGEKKGKTKGEVAR
jgi:hypothetical protein